MLGPLFKCEANKSGTYYKFIHTEKKYNDGRRFPIDEIIEADTKVDINATDRTKIGGFNISSPEFIFRWVIRGDTLCEVKIPEDSKIYESKSENGIYFSDKIILTNPVKVDDDLAMKLYMQSTLPKESYYFAMIACAIMRLHQNCT